MRVKKTQKTSGWSKLRRQDSISARNFSIVRQKRQLIVVRYGIIPKRSLWQLNPIGQLGIVKVKVK